MRLLCLALVLPCLVASRAAAQSQAFPYRAVVQSDESAVYSGNSSRYYRTSTLARGDRVTVHRHDPGGWYMIAPPEGSFSLIPAEAVQRHGETRGVVTAENVAVRVGSSVEEPPRFVMNRRLSSGDAVEILGEQTVRTPKGPVDMYKIKPPRWEYRWIRGTTVAPLDEVQKLQQENQRSPSEADREYSPAASEAGPALPQPTHSRPTPAPDSEPESRRKPGQRPAKGEPPTSSPTPADTPAVLPTGPDLERLQKDRKRLMEIDDRFRKMLKQPPGEWDLNRIEQDYRGLRQSAAHPALVNRVQMRLALVSRYRGIQQQYGEFQQVVAETTRREQRLQSLQRQSLGGLVPAVAEDAESSRPAGGASPRAGSNPDGRAARIRRQPSPQPLRSGGQWRPAGPRSAARPAGEPASPRSPVASGRARRPTRSKSVPGPRLIAPNRRTEPRPGSPSRPSRLFDAAGIVQRIAGTGRAARRGPGYVLVAPDGRVLAHLEETPGIDLRQHVGRSMGVEGARRYHRGLQSYVISVRRLTPVQLTR